MVLLSRRTSLVSFASALTSLFALPKAVAQERTSHGPSVFQRTNILYVIIDRPEDATLRDHLPNIRSLAEGIATFDSSVQLIPVLSSELPLKSREAMDRKYHPLAIIGAGSFSEWFQYGRDALWKSQLDAYMQFIRTTHVPMLAICGSHQLVAIAFNGFSAVAHMRDDGPVPTIADELMLSIPKGLWPEPRVGEEGTYPLLATKSAVHDPLTTGLSKAPWVATHHKDMVVDLTGFNLLYGPDETRATESTAEDQALHRCTVQAMRLSDSSRLLYSTQFHPEMRAFSESKIDDQGFGIAFTRNFLSLAKAFWLTHVP